MDCGIVVGYWGWYVGLGSGFFVDLGGKDNGGGGFLEEVGRVWRWEGVVVEDGRFGGIFGVVVGVGEVDFVLVRLVVWGFVVGVFGFDEIVYFDLGGFVE